MSIPVEYASQRKIRERNKLYYRLNHWPIWIFVFFIAPGPLTFDLFERGFDARMAVWLGAVLAGTAVAGVRGRLPGVEPKPYIIRFTEDRPNPLYRRFCYTFAWSEVITFAVLNIAGLVVAIVTDRWYLKEIYRYAYFPLAGTIWRINPKTGAASIFTTGLPKRIPGLYYIGSGVVDVAFRGETAYALVTGVAPDLDGHVGVRRSRNAVRHDDQPVAHRAQHRPHQRQ